jgi:hypothetical protein
MVSFSLAGGDTYDLAFGSVVLLQHLHVRVVREAAFTDGWKISRLPPGPVEVLFDLRRRHIGVYWCTGRGWWE